MQFDPQIVSHAQAFVNARRISPAPLRGRAVAVLTHRSSPAAFCSASCRYVLFPCCLYAGDGSAGQYAVAAFSDLTPTAGTWPPSAPALAGSRRATLR